MESQQEGEVTLELVLREEDAHEEDLDRTTRLLRDDLLAAHAERVTFATAAAQAGSKSPEVLTTGVLLTTILVKNLPGVIAGLTRWLEKREGRSIRVRNGTRELLCTGPVSEDLKRELIGLLTEARPNRKRS